MSIRIDCKEKEILNAKNSIFGKLHKTIMENIEQNHLNINKNVMHLLEETDQEIYGAGAVTANIADYLTKKNEALIFAELVQKSIVENYDYFNRFENCIDHLNNFHQELLNYAQELE